MTFIKIEIENWNRKEHYQHYHGLASCSYNVTEEIDVTELVKLSKYNKIDFYPLYLYLVAKTVNQIKELRMTIKDGALGYFTEAHPMYTVLNKEEQTFYALCTTYDSNFDVFLANYQRDMTKYKNSLGITPQTNCPENIINISSLPWVNFSAFEINLTHDDYLQPIITNGKYRFEHDVYLMPLSIRVNHKVTDGFHVGLFFETFKENLKKFQLES